MNEFESLTDAEAVQQATEQLLRTREVIKDLISKATGKEDSSLFAFIDVQGSTQQSEQNAVEYYTTIVSFIKEIKENIYKLNTKIDKEGKGKPPYIIPKTMGDGLLLVRNFDSKVEPKHSVDFIRLVYKIMGLLEHHEVTVKIAVSRGSKLLSGSSMKDILSASSDKSRPESSVQDDPSVTLSDDDVWGFEVNKCARVESFASGNQILVTKEIADDLLKFNEENNKSFSGCRRKSDTEFCSLSCPNEATCDGSFIVVGGWGSSLKIKAKGIAEEFEVFQVVHSKKGGANPSFSHIVSNYHFGSCIFIEFKKRKQVAPGFYSDFRAAFPSLQTVAIYKITQAHSLHYSDQLEEFEIVTQNNDTSQERLLAFALSESYDDYLARMDILLDPNNNSSQDIKNTTTYPVFSIDNVASDASSGNKRYRIEPFVPLEKKSIDKNGVYKYVYEATIQCKMTLPGECCAFLIKVDSQTVALNLAQEIRRYHECKHVWFSMGHFDIVALTDKPSEQTSLETIASKLLQNQVPKDISVYELELAKEDVGKKQ